MQKFAATILVSLISSVSTSAICHIGQRILTKKTISPHKNSFYVVRSRSAPAAPTDSTV